jgi:hypothetical protein
MRGDVAPDDYSSLARRVIVEETASGKTVVEGGGDASFELDRHVVPVVVVGKGMLDRSSWGKSGDGIARDVDVGDDEALNQREGWFGETAAKNPSGFTVAENGGATDGSGALAAVTIVSTVAGKVARVRQVSVYVETEDANGFVDVVCGGTTLAHASTNLVGTRVYDINEVVDIAANAITVAATGAAVTSTVGGGVSYRTEDP